VEALNTIDLAVIQRALSLPDMERWADEVVTICHKLGLALPEWAMPRPSTPPPEGSGS
jgi:hypothetical protein